MRRQNDLTLLSDAKTVYPCIRSRSWINPDTGALLPVAFYLRPQTADRPRERHLSIVIFDRIPLQIECITVTGMRDIKGAGEMKVGDIRRIPSLTVYEERSSKGHIDGICHREDDETVARDQAYALAACCATVIEY